jgi:hypothetical protein
MTNLYLVTCVSKSTSVSERTLDVYVIAENEAMASQRAIKAMKAENYVFHDYVKNVELIASSDKYKASSWLIGA